MSSSRCNPRQRGLGARLAIAFASQESAQHGDHPHRLPERRRRLGRLGLARREGHQRLPFLFGKVDARGHRGRLAPQPGQMTNPPRHHQVDAQTGFQAVRVAQTPRLHLAATLEHAMKHLDAPPQRIPAQLLDGGGEVADRLGAQQHPFQRRDPRRRAHFARQHRPQLHRGQVRLALGRPQLDRRKAHRQHRHPRGLVAPPRYFHL